MLSDRVKRMLDKKIVGGCNMPRLVCLSMLTIICLLNGCATQSPVLLGDPEKPYPPERAPQLGDILHMPTGVYVDQDALFDHVRRAQVVYVGETHDNPASHRLQLELLAALLDANPGKVAVGMEMFTPEQQPILDQWTAGALEEKAFLRAVGWFSNWGMNFAYYRDLMTFCKKNNIPVLGLNIDKTLQRKVGRTPFESLTDEERARLPALDEKDPYHTAMVNAVFSDHKMGQAMQDGFRRVQVLWDETMAHNISAYLTTVDKTHQLLVVAGGNHVRYGYGIPRRVFRRKPVSYVLVGSRELVVSESKKDRFMNYTPPELPMPPYDFITFTEYEDLPNPGVKLGIGLEDAQGSVRVTSVQSGSVAEKAGLLVGDLLREMDDVVLVDSVDLIYALQQLASGAKIELKISRAGESLVLPVVFNAVNVP